MDSDRGKLFIGGISWETSEQRLADYFSKYGEVTQTVIMKDRITGRARGFGFVVFADPGVLDRVLQEKHTIDGRAVEAKKAVPREEQQSAGRINNYNGSINGGQGFGGGGALRTKKIFVGGLPSSLTEEDFKKYFQQFGNITDVVVMYDHSTQRPRGFGFITFDTEDAVERVLQKTFHELNEKLVEVKRALPKEASPGGGGRMGGDRGAGGYQGYSNSGSNAGGYDGRMDNSRYGQPPAGRGGFASYGPTGYGAAGYGSGSYGPVNTGAYGYGSYGVNSYSGPPPAAPGYVGAAGYGSAPVPNSGYGNGPIGAPRSPWGNQGTSGYGNQGNSAGYATNTGYGGQAPWAPPAASVGAAPGQSPSSGSGYTNPNYGYGYSNPDASYNSNAAAAAGYGAGRGGTTPTNYNVGGAGEQAGTGAAYTGGYGDAHGSSGYSDAVWKSGGADPAAAGFTSTPAGVYGVPHAEGATNGSAGYGGGYGATGRQGQRP